MSKGETAERPLVSPEKGGKRSAGRKGPVFWILFCLFIVLGVWWTVYFRYDPERLYRAMPPNAVFVSEHENLADRWDVMKHNELVTAVARLAGVEQEEIDEVANDPVISDWIGRLASKKTVVAYVPALGRSGEPAWVLASWVGSYGQFLRWTALSSLVPDSDFETIRFDGGRKAWVLEEDPESQSRLSLAIADGVLLACISPDAEGVCRLVEQMESCSSWVPSFGKGRTEGPAGEEDGRFAEKGWYRWSVGERRARNFYELEYRMRLDGPGGSSGIIASDIVLPAASTLAESVDPQDLKNLLGEAPIAFCMLPFEYVDMLWSGGKAPQYARVIQKGLESVAASRQVFVCMLGNEYSGRMFGLRVPAFAAGIKVEDEDKSLDMVVGLLDKLNAGYGWGLIPQRVESGGHMVVLDSAKAEIRNRLGQHERPALAVVKGWLVLCSNMEALAKLRERSDGKDAADGAWLAGLTGKETADVSACAWVDLEVSGQAIKGALAVYSVLLKVSDSRGSSETRRLLGEIMAWIDLVRPLKASFVEVASDDEGCKGYFEFGDSAGTLLPIPTN
jgi:hypothetical protein